MVSILRNVTDLRRASEEIEENYRKMRIAEVQARAESDRLNLIIDSVADPIVVTDAAGATSLMNEPAERLFTIPVEASEIEQRWVQANDAHFSSFIMACGSAPTSAGSTRSPERSAVPEGVPVRRRRQDPVRAWRRPAVVTILQPPRGVEKALLYEQLKQASGELERKIQAATADSRSEQAAAASGDRARAGVGAQSQFLASMSHGFRTPLNAMPLHLDAAAGRSGECEPPGRQLGRIGRRPPPADDQRDSRHRAREPARMRCGSRPSDPDLSAR